MLYPSVLLVDDDAALLIALSDFLRFHLPGIRIDQVNFLVRPWPRFKRGHTIRW